MNEINALIKETQESSPAPSTMWEVCRPDKGLHQTMLAPWFQTFNLQNCEKYISVYKPPDCGTSHNSLDGQRHWLNEKSKVKIALG